MKKLISRLLSRKAVAETPAPPTPPIAPGPAFVAIGDIHGRADLLREVETRIEAQAPGLPVVFVGDYVDRGEQSREVLELLMSTSPKGPQPVTCLMGNHERMLLDTLDAPERYTARWLRNGGLQTLASFGVAPPRGGPGDPSALLEMRDRLAEAMGAAMIDWLRARPLSWQSGNVWAVHAGADPAHPMTDQPEAALLWGHPSFNRSRRDDGNWVVHGHTIVDAPRVEGGRIAIDTGAYATGRLTVARIEAGQVTFL